MNIFEFADVIGAELELTRYSNQNGRWSAGFRGAEVKGDGVLIGSHGNGKTPEDAIVDYVDEICGKTLVFNAYSSRDRREFNVPQDLDYE